MDKTLFKSGNFRLHSGATSSCKIDCDALSEEDVATLARIIAGVIPPFGSVEGVPTGGTRLAAHLSAYATKGPLLIVDDVLTSGKSMEMHRNGRNAIGAVIFSRGECLPWVMPVFTMVDLEEN